MLSYGTPGNSLFYEVHKVPDLCYACPDSLQGCERRSNQMSEIAWQDQPGRNGYFVTKGVQPDTYTIHRRCPFCGQMAHVTVPGPGLWAWEHGEFVQTAFPDLTPDEREQIMTGTHPECWDAMFGDDEEED